MLSTPSSKAIGIDSRLIARPKSPTTRISRRGKRSTQAPAGRVNSRNGRNSTVPSRATWYAGASSRRTAMNGMATRLTWLPNREIVAAVHSLR